MKSFFGPGRRTASREVGTVENPVTRMSRDRQGSHDESTHTDTRTGRCWRLGVESRESTTGLTQICCVVSKFGPTGIRARQVPMTVGVTTESEVKSRQDMNEEARRIGVCPL